MGQRSALGVDAAALYAIADRTDAIAQSLFRAGRTGLRFDGASAGRGYHADGQAVRRDLDLVTAELIGWARATEQIAYGLRCGAQRYAETERAVVERVVLS